MEEGARNTGVKLRRWRHGGRGGGAAGELTGASRQSGFISKRQGAIWRAQWAPDPGCPILVRFHQLQAVSPFSNSTTTITHQLGTRIPRLASEPESTVESTSELSVRPPCKHRACRKSPIGRQRWAVAWRRWQRRRWQRRSFGEPCCSLLLQTHNTVAPCWPPPLSAAS